MAERKLLSMSKDMHSELNKLAKAKGVYMTEAISIMMAHVDDIDWKKYTQVQKKQRVTFSNVRAYLDSLIENGHADMDMPSKKLADLCGCSVAMIDAVTGRSQERAVEFLQNKRKLPDVTTLASGAKISEKLATRIIAILTGDAKPSKRDKERLEPILHRFA